MHAETFLLLPSLVPPSAIAICMMESWLQSARREESFFKSIYYVNEGERDEKNVSGWVGCEQASKIIYLNFKSSIFAGVCAR